MKKQFLFLTGVLIFIFTIYSLYYYSNFRVNFSGIVADSGELTATVFPDSPDNQTGSGNVIYSPTAMDIIRKENVPSMGPSLIYYSGNSGEEAISKISDLTERVLNSNYTDSWPGTEGKGILFIHNYHNVILKNNFRPVGQDFRFKGHPVKGLRYAPLKDKAGIKVYQAQKLADSSFVITLPREGKDTLFLAHINSGNTPAEKYHYAEMIRRTEPNKLLSQNDQLAFPIIHFGIKKNWNSGDPVEIVQKITMDLNAEYSILGNEAHRKGTGNSFIFNTPFLLYFKNQEGLSLMLWIENTELLLSVKE